MWQGRAQSRCSEPSPGADVAGVGPVPVQMWAGTGPVPVQMWAGASPVPVQMWAGASPVPEQMWAGAGPVLVQMWAGAGGRTVFSESKYLSSASWSTNHRFFQLRLHAVTAQFWCRRGQGWAQSRCRRGTGEPAKSTFPLSLAHPDQRCAPVHTRTQRDSYLWKPNPSAVPPFLVRYPRLDLYLFAAAIFAFARFAHA